MTLPEVLTVTLVPQRRRFSDLAEVLATFPEIKMPQPLPASAQLQLADWQYPPRVVPQIQNERVVGTTIDSNIKPSLDWGHVQLVFGVNDGHFVIDQGIHVAFGLPGNRNLGAPTPLQLANGRSAFTRAVPRPDIPTKNFQVVGWAENGRHLALWSADLSLDRLKEIGETIR